MKCLNCRRDNDYRARQRTGGACEGCGRRFVFEPRRGDPLTDPSFQNAIDLVSEGGTLAWLEDQLYYEVARRIRRRRLYHRLTLRRRVSIDRNRFDELLLRWTSQHGVPAGRLRERAFAEGPRTESRVARDGEHPYERLLVCSSNDVVDFLLANGFHGDHRCAVLSATGYPTWACAALMPELRASPPGTIAVVHDADPEGCLLVDHVRESAAWFGGVGGAHIVDGGLRPAQARRFRGLLAYSRGAVEDSRFPKDESRWLASYRLELTAMRPRALLGILAAIVSGVEEQREQGSDAGAAFVPVDVWGGDGGDVGDDGVG